MHACVQQFSSYYIDALASEECKQDAIPFLCQYRYPIYSCSEQKVVLPTKEECERITTTTCQVEVSLAASFGLDNLLPDCNGLPTNKSITGTHNICNYIVPDKSFRSPIILRWRVYLVNVTIIHSLLCIFMVSVAKQRPCDLVYKPLSQWIIHDTLCTAMSHVRVKVIIYHAPLWDC